MLPSLKGLSLCNNACYSLDGLQLCPGLTRLHAGGNRLSCFPTVPLLQLCDLKLERNRCHIATHFGFTVMESHRPILPIPAQQLS